MASSLLVNWADVTHVKFGDENPYDQASQSKNFAKFEQFKGQTLTGQELQTHSIAETVIKSLYDMQAIYCKTKGSTFKQAVKRATKSEMTPERRVVAQKTETAQPRVMSVATPTRNRDVASEIAAASMDGEQEAAEKGNLSDSALILQMLQTLTGKVDVLSTTAGKITEVSNTLDAHIAETKQFEMESVKKFAQLTEFMAEVKSGKHVTTTQNVPTQALDSRTSRPIKPDRLQQLKRTVYFKKFADCTAGEVKKWLQAHVENMGIGNMVEEDGVYARTKEDDNPCTSGAIRFINTEQMWTYLTMKYNEDNYRCSGTLVKRVKAYRTDAEIAEDEAIGILRSVIYENNPKLEKKNLNTSQRVTYIKTGANGRWKEVATWRKGVMIFTEAFKQYETAFQEKLS